MRRGSDDKKWQSVKALVRERDRGKCRLLRVLSIEEVAKFRKNGIPLPFKTTLDSAHIYPVSRYPELIYDQDNLVLLNRFSHTSLDGCKDPITGKPIKKEKAFEWFLRIAGKEQSSRLEEKIDKIKKERFNG